MGTAAQHRYFFGSGSAAAFFRHQRQAAALLFFEPKKHPIPSKYSAAAATAIKLFPRLFSIHIITGYRLESLLSLFFTLLLLPRYFSLVEQTRLPL